jgi:WD40 repeat protein
MFAFQPHKRAVQQLAFSPDGASLATCGSTPGACVSDAVTGTARWHTGRTRYSISGLAYSPDGTRLAVVEWNKLSVFDAHSGATVHECVGRGPAVAFTPDGQSVVAGNVYPTTGASRIHLPTGRAEPIGGLAAVHFFHRLRYSPDGRFLAAHADSSVRLVDEAGALIASQPLSHPTGGVGALAFHPTAPVLVYTAGPKLIVYDLEARVPVAERKRSKKYPQDAALTPDGRHLFTVSNDKTAVLWETSGWTEVREFAWDIGQLKAVAVAPDGTRAACASDRGRVVVWDLDL